MKLYKHIYKSVTLTTLLYTGFAAGSFAQNATTNINPETKAPVITTTSPTDGEQNADLSDAIEITFNSQMDETTINETTLLLYATPANPMHEDHSEMHDEMMDDQIRDRSTTESSDHSLQGTKANVNGTISYSNKVATFTPDEELKEGTLYTFTVTNGVESSDNIALENEQKWSFSTMGTSDSDYSEQQSGIYETGIYGLDRNENSESTSDSTKKGMKNMQKR